MGEEAKASSHFQAVALAERGDALPVHREAVLGLDRADLLGVGRPAGEVGRHLLEIALEARRRDQLKSRAGSSPAFQERVWDPRGFTTSSPGPATAS